VSVYYLSQTIAILYRVNNARMDVTAQTSGKAGQNFVAGGRRYVFKQRYMSKTPGQY